LVAHKLGINLSCTWLAQRRVSGRTLKARLCDVLIGLPAHYELVQTTRRYCRSSYVFVSRADRKLHLVSIKDQRLRQLKVGVHLIGDDGSNTPALLYQASPHFAQSSDLSRGV
jgi:mxaJ protein